MHRLAAIVFDFDGVVADCQRAVLLPGAASFVRRAAAQVPLAIASGASTAEIERILERHALRDAFVALVGADQTARSKPSPDPYLEAHHRICSAGFVADVQRTVAIDDSLWGLVSARTAKLRCVGIARDGNGEQLRPHAELVVTGLDALTLDMLVTLVNKDP